MDKKQDRTLVDARQHVLYTGVTMTGKTTLARHHARILDRVDYDVVVYDPVLTDTAGGGWPEKAKLVSTPEDFDKLTDTLKGDPDRPVFLFVDESADLFSHSEVHRRWIPRKIRHQNVYLRLIAQRPKMIHPDVRTQTAHGYVFRLAKDDARMICADYGHGADVYNEELDTGECLLLTSGSREVEKFHVEILIPQWKRPD